MVIILMVITVIAFKKLILQPYAISTKLLPPIIHVKLSNSTHPKLLSYNTIIEINILAYWYYHSTVTL